MGHVSPLTNGANALCKFDGCANGGALTNPSSESFTRVEGDVCGWAMLLELEGLAIVSVAGWLPFTHGRTERVSTAGSLRLRLRLATPPFLPVPLGMPRLAIAVRLGPHTPFTLSRKDLRLPLTCAVAMTCEQMENPLNIGQFLSQQNSSLFLGLLSPGEAEWRLNSSPICF